MSGFQRYNKILDLFSEERSSWTVLEISKSLTGIQNLKITYKDDTFIQSRLDVINEKTHEIKNELSRQLQI